MREHTLYRRLTAARALALLAAGAIALTASGCFPALWQGRGNAASGPVPAMVAPPRPLPLAGKVAPPASGAFLGVFDPPAPFVMGPVKEFESQAGKRTAIVMWYQQWAPGTQNDLDPAALVRLWSAGKVPMLSWEPWDPSDVASDGLRAVQPKYRLATIVRGKHDVYIRRWARRIAEVAGPVMLRPMHEMNGWWYPWGGFVNGNTPELYRAAWRHIHDLFEQEGAHNVTWVWSVNHHSVPDTPKNSYGVYYPGDAYVDWVALSGFNYGTATPWSHWGDYTVWYDEPIAYAKTLSKPICIAEIGSVEQGGDKATWLADAFRRIKSEAAIKAVVYFDYVEYRGGRTQDWRITTSPSSLDAFRTAITGDHFLGKSPEVVGSWWRSLTAAEKSYLLSLSPVYQQ